MLTLCKTKVSLKWKDAFKLQISFHLNHSSGYLGESCPWQMYGNELEVSLYRYKQTVRGA